ncbi:hypothetical protein JCM3770_000411 [Rhodotorula araucariae]
MPASLESSSADSSTALPLASFVAAHAPTHPLPRLLVDPVVPRVAAVEAALLTSRPATLLLRLGVASERSIVALALVALAGTLARYRNQWRAVLWALGLGEALGRTVRLLQRADGAPPSRGDPKRAGAGQRDPEDDFDAADETPHVLSFWLLFAALSLFDTLRSTPSAAATAPPSRFAFLALPERVRAGLRSARRTYLHFIRLYLLPTLLRTRWAARAFIDRYPAFDPAPHLAKLPTLPSFPYALPSFAAASRPGRGGTFPQPRSRPWDPLPTSLPLSWSYFAYPSSFSPSPACPAYSARAAAAAEARWEALKLVLLWTGLRRDAWGAKSLVWDWVVGPFLGALPRLGQEGAVLRVVREPVAPPRTAPAFHDRPYPSQDETMPLSPAPSTLATSATPRRVRGGGAAAAYSALSPYAYSLAWTPPRAGTTAASSASTRTPRLVRTPSLASAAASTRTASPRPRANPFVLHDPPAGRAGYRSAAAEHPLLLGGGDAPETGTHAHPPAPSEHGSLLFEQSPPLTSPLVGDEMTEYGSAEGEGEGEGEGDGSEPADEGEASDTPPPTPGEEEAEEGARRWAAVLAAAQVQARRTGLDPEALAGAGRQHVGGTEWSASA